jgi:hypothetical protein
MSDIPDQGELLVQPIPEIIRVNLLGDICLLFHPPVTVGFRDRTSR